MRLFHIFIFLIFSFSIFAQNEPVNRMDSQGRKQGLWKKVDDQGKLVYEGRFVNNVPTGEFRYYHETGELKSISNFLNGVHKVKTTMFHPNGKSASEGIFVDQIKDGEWKYWDTDGTLIAVENYKLGIKEGLWATYSAGTGTLLQEEHFLDGKLHGVCKSYFTDGNPSNLITYVNGKRNGLSESYLTDKKVATHGHYHNNRKTGIWEYYSQNGHLRKTIEYQNDRAIKIYLHFARKVQGNTIYPTKENSLKLNQDSIAFFIFADNTMKVVSKNGKEITIGDDMLTIRQWADIMVFTPVSPHLYAANEAIKGYHNLDDEIIEVEVTPAYNFEYQENEAQGEEAKAIMSLFNTDPIEFEGE
jgi:antitoxin component YwqK of YwqJK toxin-antitoxin module